jgi:hypothetical protein
MVVPILHENSKSIAVGLLHLQRKNMRVGIGLELRR